MRRCVFFLTACFAVFGCCHALANDQMPAEIIEDSFSFKAWDSGDYVFSIGRIQNTSDHTLIQATIEVRYLDSNGHLIDTTVEEIYTLAVPPGEDAAFKLQTRAVADADSYASHELKILSTYLDEPVITSPTTRSEPQKRNLWMQLLISSFPILLLIAVWIFFMWRMGGKSSVQNQSLELMVRQNELIDRQTDALNRLAGALNPNERSDRTE